MVSLDSFATEDFQNRKGNYPKSDIPTSIDVYGNTMEFSFKNTTKDKGISWVRDFCRKNTLIIESEKSYQDGDYQNDWIIVRVKIGG